MTNPPPILSYVSKPTGPTLHPLVIWCLAIVFVPETTVLVLLFDPDFGLYSDKIMMVLSIVGCLVAPLVGALLSFLAMLQIVNSRGRKKGYPIVMGTLVVSLFHFAVCGCLSLVILSGISYSI